MTTTRSNSTIKKIVFTTDLDDHTKLWSGLDKNGKCHACYCTIYDVAGTVIKQFGLDWLLEEWEDFHLDIDKNCEIKFSWKTDNDTYFSSLPDNISENFVNLLMLGQSPNAKASDCYVFMCELIRGRSYVDQSENFNINDLPVFFTHLEQLEIGDGVTFINKDKKEKFEHSAVYLGGVFFISLLGANCDIYINTFDELKSMYKVDAKFLFISDLVKRLDTLDKLIKFIESEPFNLDTFIEYMIKNEDYLEILINSMMDLLLLNSFPLFKNTLSQLNKTIFSNEIIVTNLINSENSMGIIRENFNDYYELAHNVMKQKNANTDNAYPSVSNINTLFAVSASSSQEECVTALRKSGVS